MLIVRLLNWQRSDFMSGEQKEIAARHVIECMFESGCVDDKEKRTLLFRLDSGDMTVLEDVRVFLVNIADKITK